MSPSSERIGWSSGRRERVSVQRPGRLRRPCSHRSTGRPAAARRRTNTSVHLERPLSPPWSVTATIRRGIRLQTASAFAMAAILTPL